MRLIEQGVTDYGPAVVLVAAAGQERARRENFGAMAAGHPVEVDLVDGWTNIFAFNQDNVTLVGPGRRVR